MARHSKEIVFIPSGADLSKMRKNPASLGSPQEGGRPIEYGGKYNTAEQVANIRIGVSGTRRPISQPDRLGNTDVKKIPTSR